MNNDRIAELYEGTIGNADLQRVSRRRIHWMCAQAVGEQVVDVGCSQGIASLLLGREGRHVLGIDSERAAIDEAQRRLDTEEAEVSDRVSFVLGDARELPCEPASVDTVLMGEFLEHQINLEGPLHEAARVLTTDGRLVITTPYGVHEYHDHKEPLYLGALLEALAPSFAISDLGLIGRYLTVVATPWAGEPEPSAQIWREALGVAERRLAHQDRAVEDHSTAALDLRTRLRELEQKLASRVASLDAARGRVAELETRSEKLAELMSRLEIAATERKSEVAGLQLTLKRRDADAVRAKARERAAAEQLAHQGKQLRRTSDQLDRVLSSRSFRAVQLAWRMRSSRRARLALGAGVAVMAVLAALVPPGAVSWWIALAAAGAMVAGGVAAAVAGLRRPPASSMPAASAGSFGKDAPAARERVSGRAPAPRQIIVASPRVAIDVERQRWQSGQHRVDPRELRVATVMDEMSRACFAPECELVSFGMEDWRDALEAHEPHMLLVESAWNGNGGTWQYGVASYTHPHYAGLPQLTALVEWCREREIPTVFWNKEDPVHFERFKEAAALFDHVLTTDAHRIGAYEALGAPHVRSVGALPFAAQPRLHNPVGAAHPRLDAPVFAGTYYRNRHPERQGSLEMILDAARPLGLVIYDRTFGTSSPEYGFPERFTPHIAGRLPYDRVIETYKAHKVFVNANSVTDSPTMFSRRVFELLACGTGVVSTESVGIEAIFGDLVPVVGTPAEATAALERWIQDEGYRVETSTKAARLVLGQHTYRERMATVARTAGFDVDTASAEAVAVLACLDGRGGGDELTRLIATLAGQTRAPREVVLSTRDDADIAAVQQALPDAGVRGTAHMPDAPAAERIRELAALATAPWVAVLDATTEYDDDHLTDLHLATRYAEADVLGRAPAAATTNGARPSRYAHDVAPDAAIARREIVAARGWNADDPSVMRAWFREGVRFFHTGP
jgi:SAM-dependent methyltransferase